MGNRYSLLREEEEEAEFQRLVEDVEVALRRPVGYRDVEAGLRRPSTPIVPHVEQYVETRHSEAWTNNGK